MLKPRVVCIGVVTLDALALVEHYPEPDERVVANQISFAGGGPAATAAVVLARQGIPVGFVGRVGTDGPGDQTIAQLVAEDVDVSGVSHDPLVPTQTSCIVVSRESASRAICTRGVPPIETLTDEAMDLIADAEWVLADHLGFAPLARALPGLSRRPLVAVDAGNQIAELQLPMIDLFIPTVSSMSVLTATSPTDPDAGAAALLGAGVGSIVATAGEKGSFAWWSTNSRIAEGTGPGQAFSAAITGVEITSTLGAGDVFHGGLLAALCRGEDWAQAMRSANATAALSCRALDGRTAIPDLTELSAFLAA